MRSNLIFNLLGVVYTVILVRGLSKNPSIAKDIMNPQLTNITKLLGDRNGAAAGWTHFLSSDLFVGRWIYLDSLERGKTARVSLLATFLAGPLGLLSYLTLGQRGKKRRGPVVVKKA
jgi:hypothetical protein